MQGGSRRCQASWSLAQRTWSKEHGLVAQQPEALERTGRIPWGKEQLLIWTDPGVLWLWQPLRGSACHGGSEYPSQEMASQGTLEKFPGHLDLTVMLSTCR